MIKKDLADIRKHMKVESTMLQLGKMYSVYLKMDNQAIIHKELTHFNAIDGDTQELYIKNFKKVLSGSLDTKLFELDFTNTNEEGNTQKVLHTAVDTESEEEWVEKLDEMVEKIASNFPYENDIVITFVKGQYWKGSSKRRKEADESADDSVIAFNFLLTTVNKIDHPKKALQFDYKDKEFKTNSVLDAIINLNAPVDGFMFPSFNNNLSDVNHLMYYTAKSKSVNIEFIENVLNCGWKITAQEERNHFNAILKVMAGDNIKPEVMKSVYEKLAKKLEEAEEREDGEETLVTLDDIQEVLEDSGIEIHDIADLENAYEESIGSTNHEFKVANIVPDYHSKSIKIISENANISIAPSALGFIKQVKDKHGRTCLLIELTQDIDINGIDIETEGFEEE